MKITETTGNMIGLHQFTAYEGDVKRDKNGKVLNKVVYKSPVYKNMIVTTGKNLTLDRLFGLSSAVAITSVGVGTGSGAAALTDTQLTAGAVVQTADLGTSRTGQVVTITSTFGTGVANFSWNEAGLFNGNVNGTSVMFNRVVIGPFTKSGSVSIVYQTTVTQS